MVQPLTGIALAVASGIDLGTSWLVMTYLLYVLALVCWLPVVGLQIRMRDMAQEAASNGTPLPPAYHRAMRQWSAVGWPAFTGLVIVFLLMIAKPELW